LYIKNYEVENTNDNIENFTDSFSIDGSQYYLITKYIKKHNVKMAITGVGADEMFNSYPSSKFIPLFRKYNRILPNIENKINFKFNSKIERVLRLLFNCKTVSDSYLIFREIYSEKEIKNINLKNFDFSQETFSLNENISEYIKGIRSVKNQIKSLETNIYLRDQVLKDVDYASMKNSIEVRVPYLSKEILRISSNLNISENISKQFLLDRFDLKKSYKKNYKKVGFMTLNSISNMNKTKMLEYLNF
jgi:asparagine synthase (glutamine-hydrolysing)